MILKGIITELVSAKFMVNESLEEVMLICCVPHPVQYLSKGKCSYIYLNSN